MSILLDAIIAHRGIKTPLDAAPTHRTYDADADAMLAAYFGKLATIYGHRKLVAQVEEWIGDQERLAEEFHFAERSGRGDPAGRQSHARVLGGLMTWLRELRGIDLDMAGQDHVEGRRAQA